MKRIVITTPQGTDQPSAVDRIYQRARLPGRRTATQRTFSAWVKPRIALRGGRWTVEHSGLSRAEDLAAARRLVARLNARPPVFDVSDWSDEDLERKLLEHAVGRMSLPRARLHVAASLAALRLGEVVYVDETCSIQKKQEQ